MEDKLKKAEKDLFDKNYRVKQMEEMRKLSIKNRDCEAEAKKQAVEEAEKLRRKLVERKADFDSKLREAKSAL